jgi:hypothetical protein
MQLVQFRDMVNTIADKCLEEKGVSLGKGRARAGYISDIVVYRQGILDGRKVDVKRKRIEG